MNISKKILYLILITAATATQCADQDTKKAALNDSLIIATQKNLPELVKPLIESGADVNTKSKDGDTPLIIAAKNMQRVVQLSGAPSIIERDKSLEIIKTLVENNADLKGFEAYATQEPFKVQLMFNDKIKKYLATLPARQEEEKKPETVVKTEPTKTAEKPQTVEKVEPAKKTEPAAQAETPTKTESPAKTEPAKTPEKPQTIEKTEPAKTPAVPEKSEKTNSSDKK